MSADIVRHQPPGAHRSRAGPLRSETDRSAGHLPVPVASRASVRRGIGQPSEPGAAGELGEVAQGGRIVATVEGGVEARSQAQGSSTSRMRPTVSAACRASASRPSPLELGRGGTQDRQSWGTRPRPSGRRRPPARAGGRIPGPIGRGAASIGRRGPIRGPASRRARDGRDRALPRRPGRWPCFGATDVVGMSRHDRLELGQPRVAIRIGPRGCSAIRRKTRHPGVDVARRRLESSPARCPGLLVGQLGSRARVSSPSSAPVCGKHPGIRLPARVPDLERPALDPQDPPQEPPGPRDRSGRRRWPGGGCARPSPRGSDSGGLASPRWAAPLRHCAVQPPPGSQRLGPIFADGRLGLWPVTARAIRESNHDQEDQQPYDRDPPSHRRPHPPPAAPAERSNRTGSRRGRLRRGRGLGAGAERPAGRRRIGTCRGGWRVAGERPIPHRPPTARMHSGASRRELRRSTTQQNLMCLEPSAPRADNGPAGEIGFVSKR